MSWGVQQWGGGQWGAGGASVTVDTANAIATKVVRIGMTGVPLVGVATRTGDALNKATWTIWRTDTLDVFTVVQVDYVDDVTYDITVVENFGPVNVLHQVSALPMLTPALIPIDLPASATFYGLEAAETSVRQPDETIDFTNFPAPVNPPGGTLQISGAGDYKTEGGEQLVRKLIIRRLTTAPGEFFHLPNYGLGLRVKEPLPIADLRKLKAAINEAVQAEREVIAVDTALEVSGETLIAQLRVKLKAGSGNLNMLVHLPPSLVQL